ncbi:DUF4291 family protein [Nocardia sp. NPDC052112]|uniref:DUF4291 family protein n=1 Tax=Nocardia sp. NPDC052112 TaxID=3155646 RepID=UPI003427394F
MRRIRASYDDATVVVYQAYSPQIAEPAVAGGTFVNPFKRSGRRGSNRRCCG